MVSSSVLFTHLICSCYLLLNFVFVAVITDFLEIAYALINLNEA